MIFCWINHIVILLIFLINYIRNQILSNTTFLPNLAISFDSQLTSYGSYRVRSAGLAFVKNCWRTTYIQTKHNVLKKKYTLHSYVIESIFVQTGPASRAAEAKWSTVQCPSTNTSCISCGRHPPGMKRICSDGSSSSECRVGHHIYASGDCEILLSQL